MARPKPRSLQRLLQSTDAAIWLIDGDGTLAFLNDAAGRWLGVEPADVIGRRSVAGSPHSRDSLGPPDPLDIIAAALSPPTGWLPVGSVRGWVSPPGGDGEERQVRFIRLGNDVDPITLGVTGAFADSVDPLELAQAVETRRALDRWRRRAGAHASIATAGGSTAARLTRRRVTLATQLRTDIVFVGPPGSGAEAIARQVHAVATPDESLLTIDGPLMDADLLEATLSPLVHAISHDGQRTASALIRGIDEMPVDGQIALARQHARLAGRLRLLALVTGPLATLETDAEPVESPILANEPPPRGLTGDLIEVLSGFSIPIEPLADRIGDVPLLASALLDARIAAGESAASGFGRAAFDTMAIYPWPRNFEELDQTIRYASQRCEAERTIEPEHLPLAIRSYRPGGGTSASIDLDAAVAAHEMRLIEAALDASGGNRAEAARRLGISRARLLRKIDDHNKAGER